MSGELKGLDASIDLDTLIDTTGKGYLKCLMSFMPEIGRMIPLANRNYLS